MHIFTVFSGSRQQNQNTEMEIHHAYKPQPSFACVAHAPIFFFSFWGVALCPSMYLAVSPSNHCTLVLTMKVKCTKDCIGLIGTNFLKNFFYLNFWMCITVKFAVIKNIMLCIFPVQLGPFQRLIAFRRCHNWAPVKPLLLTQRTLRATRGVTDPSSSACVSEA